MSQCRSSNTLVFTDGAGKEYSYIYQFNNAKEIPMTSDYRRGVEDALKLDIMFIGSYTGDYLLKKINERLKNLLTKKVTKWVNVYADGTKVSVAPGTFDTEQAAKEGAIPIGVPSELFGSSIGTYQKTVPFEIEVPID